MATEMTSRERVVAAMRRGDVDHVPFSPYFWDNRHPNAPWADERGRLAYYVRRGWDGRVFCNPVITMDPAVTVEFDYETRGDVTVLHQVWRTPARTIEERLRVTDDWPEAAGRTTPMWFEGDFRSPRYLEVPFKEPADLDAIPYLFPVERPRDFETMRRSFRAAQALAREFGQPIFCYHVPAGDWLTYLYPPQEVAERMVDQPGMMNRLVGLIHQAYTRRLEVLLELDVDVIMRRAIYETCDFLNPRIFAESFAPLLAGEIDIVHRAGKVYMLEMMSGFQPLLPQMARLPFDCLSFFDPVHGGLDGDLRRLAEALPGKCFRGGLSGPAHMRNGTGESIAAAVARAFEAFGRRGFILSHAGAFRSHWPWANLEAADRAWRRLR